MPGIIAKAKRKLRDAPAAGPKLHAKEVVFAWKTVARREVHHQGIRCGCDIKEAIGGNYGVEPLCAFPVMRMHIVYNALLANSNFHVFALLGEAQRCLGDAMGHQVAAHGCFKSHYGLDGLQLT